jgi:hypothetical protein
MMKQERRGGIETTSTANLWALAEPRSRNAVVALKRGGGADEAGDAAGSRNAVVALKAMTLKLRGGVTVGVAV